MSERIYKHYQMKAREPWYQLSEAEQRQLLGRIEEALEQVGGRSVLVCFSAWSNEQVEYWGVEEYPDLAAVQSLAQIHEEIGWYRYVESTSILGTALPQI